MSAKREARAARPWTGSGRVPDRSPAHRLCCSMCRTMVKDASSSENGRRQHGINSRHDGGGGEYDTYIVQCRVIPVCVCVCVCVCACVHCIVVSYAVLLLYMWNTVQRC